MSRSLDLLRSNGPDRISRLLNPDFSSVGSDATSVAEEEYLARLERKRRQEELQRQLAARPSQVVTKPATSGLLSRALLEPATGLIEPEGMSFSGRTERRLKTIPGFDRPSRLLGAPVEALADVVGGVGRPIERLAGPSKDDVADLEARLLDEDYGKKQRKPLKPGDYLYAGPVAKKPSIPSLAAVDKGLEMTPAQLAGLAGEALVPTPADVAGKLSGFVLNPALMGGLALAGGLKNIGKGALEARRAAKAAETVADVSRLEKASLREEKLAQAAKATADRLGLGIPAGTETRTGRILGTKTGESIPLPSTLIPGRLAAGGKTEEIVREAATEARGVREVEPGYIAAQKKMTEELAALPKQIGYRPVGREFVGKAGISKRDALRPATKVIRDMGGMAENISRPTANAVANIFDRTTRDFRIYLNEAVASSKPILKEIDKLTDDQARAFARAVKLKQYTGDPTVDAVIKRWMPRRQMQRERLVSKGVPVPGDTGFPQINLEATEIALLSNTSEQKARAAIVELYAKHRPDRKLDEATVENVLRNMQALGKELMPVDRQTKFAPNITESRTLDLPGHLADAESPHFTRAGLKESIKLYDKQWAFALADAEHAGPDAAKFAKLMEQTGNPVFRDYVFGHREHYIGGGFGKTPADRGIRAAMGEFRSIRTAALLGNSWLPQLFETLPRVLPKSMSVVGLKKGADIYRRAIAEFVRTPADAVEYTRKIGALSDQLAMELTGSRSLFEKGAAKTQVLPEVVLGKLTPFELINRGSYSIGAAAAKLHLQEVGKVIETGGRDAAKAEEFIRKTMPANPDEAQRLINAAKSGRDLLDEADDAVKGARDIYAYEWDLSALGDAGPNVSPLAASTDWGRLAFHLKNFDYQYTRFIWNDLISEARNGNYAPLITWAGIAAPASGYATRIARMAAAGDMEGIKESMDDEGFIEGLMLNHGAAGGFGLAGTVVSAVPDVLSGKPWDIARGTSQLLGPELGFPIEAGVRAHDQGIPRAILNTLVPNPLGIPRTAERLLSGREPMNARDFTPEWLKDEDWYKWRVEDLGNKPKLRGMSSLELLRSNQ